MHTHAHVHAYLHGGWIYTCLYPFRPIRLNLSRLYQEGQIGLVYMMATIFGTAKFEWRSVIILTFTACAAKHVVMGRSGT